MSIIDKILSCGVSCSGDSISNQLLWQTWNPTAPVQVPFQSLLHVLMFLSLVKFKSYFAFVISQLVASCQLGFLSCYAVDVPFVSKYCIEVLVCKLARTAEYTSIISKNHFPGVYLLCAIWCLLISARPVIKGQRLRTPSGYYEHDLQLCTFMGNKRKKEQKNLLVVQFLPANFIHLTTWNLSDSSVIHWKRRIFFVSVDRSWPVELVGVKKHGLINSLYRGHCGDLELVSSL